MFQIPLYLLKNLSIIILKLISLRKQKYQWQRSAMTGERSATPLGNGGEERGLLACFSVYECRVSGLNFQGSFLKGSDALSDCGMHQGPVRNHFFQTTIRNRSGALLCLIQLASLLKRFKVISCVGLM